ncbi:hypothetical protein C5167_008802 [Papaver somniferum]|uniref:Uncharacterized protein n=1 Tax=Papaver somniferum TaxID=3469 RepID=A0A4Y7JZ97_PAPSO|nr:hypothetical protein C5167_008802 [Papaver somniferum]
MKSQVIGTLTRCITTSLPGSYWFTGKASPISQFQEVQLKTPIISLGLLWILFPNKYLTLGWRKKPQQLFGYFIVSMSVSKDFLALHVCMDVLALASLKVDLSGIEPDSTVTVKWRGKADFIKRRMRMI